MESNAQEKSTNKSVTSSFWHELLKFDRLLEFVMLWIRFSDNHSDFSKNFLNLRFDALE